VALGPHRPDDCRSFQQGRAGPGSRPVPQGEAESGPGVQVVRIGAAIRLSGGNAGSARAAASFVRQAIGAARAAGATGQILVRADSAFGSGAMVSACRTAGVNFSLPLQSNPKLRAAIAAIDVDAWTAVCYPGAVYDEQTEQWISNAEVAETRYTAIGRIDWPAR
jgi:Transposase DDE domain group 1